MTGLKNAIFAYHILVLIILGALAAGYLGQNHDGKLQDWVAPRDAVPPVALYAAWFGALGAVAAGMKGVYDHRTTWDDSYSLWHLGRPVTGAVVGGVTYVLLLAVNEETPKSQPAIELAAFALGMQDRRFFNLLYEAAKLIVSVPGEIGDLLGVSGTEPVGGAPGDRVSILGSGFVQGTTVRLGKIDVDPIAVVKNGTRIDVIVPDLEPSKVDLMVTNPDGSAFVRPGVFEIKPKQP